MNLKNLSIDTIEAVLDAMPLDASFIDAEDTLVYFNTPAEGRIFPRTKMDLGRKVQKCHPQKSVEVVEKILKSFRSGAKQEAVFWINLQGKTILIKYFPVRDKAGAYCGTLEVTQDITGIKKIEGERRLLSWEQ
jgi:uncharacterized protein